MFPTGWKGICGGRPQGWRRVRGYKDRQAPRLSCKIAPLQWQALTIVLRRDGFKNCNKLCMVAHFHSEAAFCVSHTFSFYRDDRPFCRYSIQRWRVWRKLSQSLGRFTSLLVEWASYTTRTAKGGVRFGMNWLHTNTSSARQNGAAYMWTSCLRK